MTSKKVQLPSHTVGFPMPVAVLGTEVNGKPNFMTVAWFTRVNFKPPMIAIAIGNSHVSYEALREAQTFGLSITNEDQRIPTDYVGIVSAKKNDKSDVFPVFTGELEKAPMIANAPLAMECRIVETLDLPTNTVFVGEIISIWGEEAILDNDRPDLARMRPLILSMPDNRYWRIGEPVGHAWRDGKDYQTRSK